MIVFLHLRHGFSHFFSLCFAFWPFAWFLRHCGHHRPPDLRRYLGHHPPRNHDIEHGSNIYIDRDFRNRIGTVFGAYWEQLSYFQQFSDIFRFVYHTFEPSVLMVTQWQGENEYFERLEGPKVRAQAPSVRQAILCLPHRSSIYEAIPHY